MTIREAEMKLKSKQNELDYWITKKNIALESAQPKATSYDSERVDGGKRVDKYKHLDNSIDEIDPIIDVLNKEICNLEKYLDEQLKIIGEYDIIANKIYNLRNDNDYIKTHNGKKREWWKIAQLVGYTERHCYRIYAKITGKRYGGE